VRVRRGLAQDVLREGVVDLDLRVAVRGVPVDGLLGLVEVLDHEAVARRHLALAFDEAGRDDVRGQQGSRLLLGDDLLQRGVVVAHVAHGGDAGGDVQAAVPAAQVAMHVEQARQQHASPASMTLSAAPCPVACTHDAAVAHQHVRAAHSVACSLSKHACVAIRVCP
jgi:hypothetical protein